MFCEKCGKENPDGTRFCDGCGHELTPASESNNNTEIKMPTSMDDVAGMVKNPMIQRIIIIAVCAILLIAGVLGIGSCTGCISCGGNNSPEAPVKLMAKAMETGDANVAIKAFPKEFQEIVKKNPLIKSALKESFKSEYGSEKRKVTYRIVEKERVDRKDLWRLEENYYDEMRSAFSMFGGGAQIKNINIQDAFELEVEFIIKSRGEIDTDTEYVTVYKSNGKWYMLP